MDTTTRTGTPLRQRMIEDMRMRKLEPRTREGYIRAVRKPEPYKGKGVRYQGERVLRKAGKTGKK